MPANALDYITIRGFKSIASLEKLELRPINVLIGANGSGKSNFLDVFRLLQAIGEGELHDYVGRTGGAERVLHFGSKTTAEISICLWLPEASSYQFRLLPTEDDNLFISNASISGSSAASGTDADLIAVSQLKRAKVGGWHVYHLHDASLMKKQSSVDDNRFLRRDGSNLPAFLYYLRERQRDSYDLIRATVQDAAPFFEDFKLEPVRVNPDTIKLEWKHKTSDQYFGASSLSDGTLRFIALAALFLQPVDHRPAIIIVDEPELGLHPFAIGILASLIRQASADAQVIVSTQSSLLLDDFEPEDVLVADRVGEATQLTRPEPARLANWLEEYSLGQLWEKNEIGGRPVQG